LAFAAQICTVFGDDCDMKNHNCKASRQKSHITVLKWTTGNVGKQVWPTAFRYMHVNRLTHSSLSNIIGSLCYCFSDSILSCFGVCFYFVHGSLLF